MSGTDSSQGDTDGSFPLSTEAACGARQRPNAMEHPEAGPRGTADAGEWFSKPLPPTSSCGWTWSKRSELAVGNLRTEAEENSLVKFSAQ